MGLDGIRFGKPFEGAGMKTKKFLIFAPSYRPDDGGGVVLHRLCALLNELGHEAYLTRLFNGAPVYGNDFIVPLFTLAKHSLLRGLTPFRIHPKWSTPVLSHPPCPLGAEWIVVYPEVVFGNPLQAKFVVRWFLHRPAFHTGRIFFGLGEYHVDFNEFASDFHFPGCRKASFPLNVLSFPFEYYNLEDTSSPEQRKGAAYCLRKGKGKPLVHDMRDSILIDGKQHAEVAAIFKRVKTFVSYDPHTAYSSFAVLCGAESVVIPDSGVSKEEWYSDPADRYGVAYGCDDLDWARQTASRVFSRMKEKEAQSLESVRRFAEDVLRYFSR